MAETSLSAAQARRAATDSSTYLLAVDVRQAPLFREDGWKAIATSAEGAVLFVHERRMRRLAKDCGSLSQADFSQASER